jgi:SAM-dependent methyltransferase
LRNSARGAGENPPYRWLARYYDQLFTFHLPWFQAARDQILGGILPEVESACDLACGTATTAVLLGRRGIRTYGVDLSPIMCRLARAKARRRRTALQVIRGDMRDFRLPERVDLILCEFDALNHIPRKEDLARVAHSVSRALRPGGHFFFDVNNRLAFEKVWPGVWWIEKPGVALVMHGGWIECDGVCGFTDVEWFIRDGKMWRRHHEHIKQVAWSAPEMRRALREAGFDRVRAFDATPFFTGDPRIEPGCRTFYLARKAATNA